MNLKLIPLFLSLLPLSGCMTYSESFDCPPGRGVGCKSLSQVNDMVEEGVLPLEKINTIKEITNKKKQSSQVPKGWIEAKSHPHNFRIWITEYKDEEGNLHTPSYVYSSLETHIQQAHSSEKKDLKENS